MKRIAALLAMLLALILVACAVDPPEGGDVISASVTEYHDPETIPPETEAPLSPETKAEETQPESPETEIPETTEAEQTVPVITEPEETELGDIVSLLPARLIFEVSERVSEIYDSYTRKTQTVTQITQEDRTTRSEIFSELMTNDGNASFRRSAEGGSEEYFLIDGFLCYGGKFGNYRFDGYDLPKFSELAGNYFSLEAFQNGSVDFNGEQITLIFDEITEKGILEITEMLALTDGYELSVTKAEFLYVTDKSAHMTEKKLTIEASVSFDGEELLSFSLISHTEQTGINEPNDLALPAMTSYVLISDPDLLTVYEAALADISSFVGGYKAFEFTVQDEITVGGALEMRLSDKTDYAYAQKIGASIERVFNGGSSGIMRVLTHFNHHHAFSQLNGGNIFVDTTLNSKNLETTLELPFSNALLPFWTFSRIEKSAGGGLILQLGTEGKMMLIREILLSSGIPINSVSITSCDEAAAFIELSADGKVSSIGFKINAQIRADGKSYTISRTHSLDITSRGSAKVKVIFIDVDEEEE